MESTEEVHSDGSFELVNSDDYASESDHLNMDLLDGGSYDLLCCEVSEILVLSEDEDLYNPLNNKMKSCSLESAKGGVEFKSETVSDPAEGDLNDFFSLNSYLVIKDETHEMQNANDSDHTEDDYRGFDSETSSDSTAQPIPDRFKKGKKRDFMTMLCESSDFDLHEIPSQIKLKYDIEEVAKNHITCYLPAKSLYKCRQVSKEWNKWISSPFFAHMQSQYFRKTSGFFQSTKTITRFISLDNYAYGVPYPSLGFLPLHAIKSSCNGLLLCQSTTFDDQFYICNPANMQWINLPSSTSYHGDDPKFVLAFEPSSFNFEPCYQVVCLFSVPFSDVGSIVQFDIYDSKTKSWRVSEMICADLESEVKTDGIFVNGVVYWETRGGELLAFDLKNEIYGVQRLPFNEGGALSNISGELCYVRAEYYHFMKSCILNVYGDGGMSLKKSINVSVDDVEDGELVECTVLSNSCDDVVALVVKDSQRMKRLYVYDVKDEEVHELGCFDHSKKLFPYVNSLVSIVA